MKVRIELMHMWSKPGYRRSSGYTEAILVSAEDAARCGGDSDALFDLYGEAIAADMLEDIETRTTHVGALNYRIVTGVFDVPDNKVVVQKRCKDICTRDDVLYSAWVVKPNSLCALYEERGAEYTRLANECKKGARQS